MSGLLGVAWSDILIGVIGGIVVSLFFVGVTFVHNKLLEKQYPVKGTYLTTFDDVVDGKPVSTSALAKLTQQGKHIKGETWLENNRTWIIEGQLTETGNLHGVYFAADPLDKGIGNFFLKVGNNRQMSGLWSGFDSENNMITSGKYTFRPVLDGYKIEDARREHLTQVVAICNSQLGEGFLDVQELVTMVADKQSYMCKVALVDGSVIGFCLCRIVAHEDIAGYLQVSDSSLPSFARVADRVGVIKTIATAAKYQKQGVGYSLVQKSAAALIDSGVQLLASIAWKNGDRINADGVLRSAGLLPGRTIQDFWAADSLEHGYSCPACGEPPCHCAAVLYFKAV